MSANSHPYRVRVLLEFRNGDGNFLRVCGGTNPFEDIRPGHVLDAINKSAPLALADIQARLPDKPELWPHEAAAHHD